MAQREHEWELKEKAANEYALRVMRTLLPTDINMCTVAELMKRAADQGMLYTTDFAQVSLSDGAGEINTHNTRTHTQQKPPTY